MTLTLDDLKEKAAEAEEMEMNQDADYPAPVEEPTEEPTEEPASEEEAPVETPEEEPAPQEGDVEEPVEGEPAEPAEFSFDPKIKVMDNEVEVPEFLAKNIENEEQANQVKELFEKAHGLDAVKEKRDFYKSQVGEVESKYNEVNQELAKTNENLDFLDQLIQKNDMVTFQQYAGIKDEAILKRAAEIIQYRELTPAQKAEYDNNIQSRQRQYSLEIENRELRQTQVQDEVQETHNALDTALSDETFKDVVNDFDSRVASGAFKNEVIRRAQFVAQTTGKSLSPTEAIKETMRSLGLQPSQVKTSPETTQQPAQNVPVEQRVVVKTAKPTMASVKAGAKSPVKAKVKSIDDIRRLAEQFDH